MWVKNQYNTVHRSVPKLRKSLGREPTSEELAAQVEIDTNSKVRFVEREHAGQRGAVGRDRESDLQQYCSQDLHLKWQDFNGLRA